MIGLGPRTARVSTVFAAVLPATFWGVFGAAFATGAPPPAGFPWLPPPLVGVLLVALPAANLVLWWLARSGQVLLPAGLALASGLLGAAFMGLALGALLMGF